MIYNLIIIIIIILIGQPIGGSMNLKSLMSAKLGTPINENGNRRALGELSNSVLKKSTVGKGLDGRQTIKLEKIPDVAEPDKVVDDHQYLPPEISRDALQPVQELTEHEDDDDFPEPEMMNLQPSGYSSSFL